MPLTDEFTAEIDAATTERAEQVKEDNKGESADGGDAFISDGDGGKREDTNDGGTVISPEQTGKSDSDIGESDSAGADGEGGSKEGEGSGDTSGKAGISPAAVMRAIQAGISASDALALGDDALVGQLIEQRVTAERERLEAEELEVIREKDARAAEDRLKALEESLPKLDPEETDPNVIAAFDAMKKLISDQQVQLDEFRAEQVSQHSAADAAREREVTQWFEGKVASLSSEFDKVLGDKGVNAVTITSETADTIAGRVAVMVEGYRGSNLPVPDLDTLFDEAARIVLKDDFAKMDEARLAERLEKRAGQDISRPGGSKSKTERSPVEEVADMIDKRYFADRS